MREFNKKIIGVIFFSMITVTLFADNNKASVLFNSNGELKIVQFTDTHIKPDDKKSLESIKMMNHVLDLEKPDLVVFTGDIIFAKPALKGYEMALAPTIERGIPFIVVFGNHDDEKGVSKEKLSKYITAQKGCLNTTSQDGVEGYHNDVITVSSKKDSTVKALLYTMDSQAYSTLEVVKGYGWITRSQILWYEKQSDSYTEANGGIPLPALSFFHIPLPEFNTAWKGKSLGNRTEKECSPDLNSGMFSVMLEKGDVMGVFVGHDHDNDYIGNLYNIALAYGRFSGGKTVYSDLPNGARVIVLKEGQRHFDTWIDTQQDNNLFKCSFPADFK